MSIKSREDLLNKQAEVNEQIKSYTCRVLVCSGTDVSHPELRKFMTKWQGFVKTLMVLL